MYRPKIELWFSTDSSHRSRPVLRRYGCTFPACKNKRFYRYSQLQRHLCLHLCSKCGQSFEIGKHKCPQTGAGDPLAVSASPVRPNNFQFQRAAHSKTAAIYTITFTQSFETFTAAFRSVNEDLIALLEENLNLYKGLNVSISLYTTLEKILDKSLLSRKFIGAFMIYLHKAFIQDIIKESRKYLESSLMLYERNGSGWRIKSIESIDVMILPYKPELLRLGGSYIAVPKNFQHKSIISIRTNRRCFMLTVLLAVFKDEISLPEAPNAKWTDLSYSQRRKLKRFYQNPKTYRLINKVLSP